MAITQNYQLNLGFLEIGIADKSSNFYSLSKFWFVLNYKIEKSRHMLLSTKEISPKLFNTIILFQPLPISA
jgi:hypothetical protein